MKPIRVAQWQDNYAESMAEYRELQKEFGYNDLSWHEREELKKTMTPQAWVEFTEKQQEAYRLVQDEWSKITTARSEVGQIHLNIRNNELDAFCMVFQKADRILTGIANCEVGINDTGDTTIPAWSDGKSVTFNGKAIKKIDETTLMSLHGLNYHEVAHLLYTPRVGSDLGAWVKEESEVSIEYRYNDELQQTVTHQIGDVRIRYAFNLLEDFRAENYLVTKYPSVVPFLTATIAQYALDTFDEADFDSVFILLAGRAYFPQDLVKSTANFYARANGVDKAKQFYELANEYRNLVFPKQYARAKEIIKLVSQVLPKFPQLPSGCGDRPVLRNGRGAGSVEQEGLAQNSLDGLTQEELNKLFDDLMSGKLEEESQNQEAQGQGEGYSKFGDTGESNTPANTNGKSLSEEIAKKLEEAVKQAKNDEQAQRKIDDTNKAIRKASGSKTILPRQARSTMSPTQADVVAVRSFTQELERLRIDSDPDWKRELPTGKLNVRRAMQADVNDINKLFDRWTTGNDDYDIEAVILLDRSGSMWNEIDTACKASWIIKRSLEKINANVSVITFNDSSRVLYSADEKADSTYASVLASGSTDPEYGLFETERIMQGSRKHTKLLFMLTDGQFYGRKSDETIQRLKSMGVHTNLVFLGGEGWVKWALENGEKVNHGVHNFRVITKPLDLVNVAKDVVRHHLSHA